MKPILFEENSTSWTTNGIGRLSDALTCKVTEERNGIYELEMQYPMSGQHYEDLGLRKIIVAKPSAGGSLQPFRIYKITRPLNGKVTVYGQHLCYDLSKNVCMPFSVTASSSACNTTLSRLKSNAVETCPFDFWTNVTTVASYNQKTPASIKQRLGGIEGSVLDQFGGEYEYDGYTVKLWKSRGAEKDITYRYGKNITDLEQEENIANTITGVVPYWIDIEGEDTVTLPERVVYSQNASLYSHNLVIPLDLSSEWDEAPTVSALRSAATVYINQTGVGVPKVSTKVSFINLADSEEYKESVLPLMEVNLCDTITVQFEKLGISTTAEIVETVYDVLKERYESVQIGSLKSTLASTITDMERDNALAISETGERVFAQVNTETQDIVNNATAWLTSSGGYVIAVKNSDGTWKELLFMDTNNVNTARNVLRINENGIGFSSTGVGGPYTQAWTLDGKLVIGGTNVPSITCYDSSNNILFQASASGVQVSKGTITLKDGNNNIVFQASSSGVTVGKGSISGATLTLGGSGNADGTVTLNNSSGYKVVTINNTGIHLYDGSATSTEIASLTASGITMSKGSININDKFKVSTAGAVTATSGTIGGFTIEDHYIRSGATDSTSAGAVTLSNTNFSRTINETSRSNLRFAIGGNFAVKNDGTVYMYKAVLDGGNLKLGGTEDGKIEVYNSSNSKAGEWTKDHLRFQKSNHTIDLMEYDGNAVIRFDSNSYIDGTGSGTGGGINFNTPKAVFSVSNIQVTQNRGSSTLWTGATGDVVRSLSSDTLRGICCNLNMSSGGTSWDVIDLGYIKGGSISGVVNGLVVD